MDEDDDLPEGEFIEIDDEQSDVIDTEDGGAIILLDDDAPADSEFYANLAEDAPEPELQTLATTFLDLVEHDKKARELRDKQYEEGLQRTGMGDDAPGGAEFQGASKVVHPMMTEACIDFAARAMKEIFPPGGPAKDHITGPMAPSKIDKAERKVRLLNWQLTVQCSEVRAELEQLMTQVPLGGSQYLKLGWDDKRNRPTFLFVPIDDMFLPYAATNFYTSQRKTHRQFLTEADYRAKVRSGMYRDVDLAPASMDPEQSLAGQANDKIEGREGDAMNVDGLRTIYEIDTEIDLDSDTAVKGPAPYLITIDEQSGKVLSIYRNWEEDDESREPLTHFVEFPFIPWRGVYAIGLPHLIGGLSAAATGALRALLDAAHINNSQTMARLKNGLTGQSQTIRPGETIEIEGTPMTDDIRKLAMPLPYNPPSPTLFSLLGFLVDAGKGVVSSSLDGAADMNQNAPVGTTLALIEQGATVYSSIHARLHDAMARMLRVLERLNGMHLDDEMLEREAGEVLAKREDFDGVLDVVPVSDPNIFSESQRYAQVQAVAQRAALMPQLYNARKVEERLLKTLKIPNAEDLLNPPVEPQEQNAVNENVAASMGRPVTAFPAQDHIAHLKTHLAYMTSPAFGMNPLIAPDYIPVMLNHIREHIAMWYVSATVELTSEALGEDIGKVMADMREEGDPDVRQFLDRMLAEAATTVIQFGADVFEALPPVIQQAQQFMAQLQQQMMPQPPQDPRIELEGQKLQLAAQRDQGRQQIDMGKLQNEAQKLQFQLAETQAKIQNEAERLQIEREKMAMQQQLKAVEMQARAAMNDSDNETAKEITAAKLMAGQSGNLTTGTGINP
jgi:uncharacterized cupredoxin-like copper-binding protein